MYSNYSGQIEVGMDEAGRGSWIGPVFTAAVVFPIDYQNDLINDSKKLTHNRRKELVNVIKNDAIDFSVTSVGVDKIDEFNIKNATNLAFEEALRNLFVDYKYIIVDGQEFINTLNSVPYKCFKKGDGLYLSIAAASILAKYYRDDYIINEIGPKVPHFNFESNKGYGSKHHKQILFEYGPTSYHRKSFKPMKHMI